MTVREEDIREITHAVWLSVVQAEPTRPDAAEADLNGTVMTGCVQMGGAWRGAVTVRCSTGLARTVAAAMFETEPAETADADVRDALGELANMIGGNVKALLPSPTQLSPPLVVEGGKDALTICDGVVLQAIWFQFLGEPFVVTLLGCSDAPRHACDPARHTHPGDRP